MHARYKALIVMLCMIALPQLVFGQASSTTTVDLGDGYSIAVPADWTVKRAQAGAFVFTGDSLSLNVTTPTRLHALNINFAADSNIADVLAGLAFPFSGTQLNRDNAQKLRIGSRLAASYTHNVTAETEQMYVAVTLSDGKFGYLAFSAATGTLDAQKDVIDEVIASFDSSGALVSTGSAGCTVSIDAANTAQLRVGPGPNRGAISFLPANVDVTVTGRIELDNGSVWYQLDKAEAAPTGTAAAELWVAAESITATGDCAHVGETAAPPIIQAVVVPPPASDNSGAPSDTGSAPSDTGVPGALPQTGRWTLTFNATTNASCAGYQNVPIPSTEVFDKISEDYWMKDVSAQSFNLGLSVFTRSGSSNTYFGTFNYEDGTNAQAWLTVNSSTSISGQATGNFTLDGIACSATTLFVVNKR